jgi:hypothetical protein
MERDSPQPGGRARPSSTTTSSSAVRWSPATDAALKGTSLAAKPPPPKQQWACAVDADLPPRPPPASPPASPPAPPSSDPAAPFSRPGEYDTPARLVHATLALLVARAALLPLHPDLVGRAQDLFATRPRLASPPHHHLGPLHLRRSQQRTLLNLPPSPLFPHPLHATKPVHSDSRG